MKKKTLKFLVFSGNFKKFHQFFFNFQNFENNELNVNFGNISDEFRQIFRLK